MVSVGAASTSSWPTDGRTDNERNDMCMMMTKRKSRQKKATFFDEEKKIKSSFVRVRYFIFFSLERGEESPLFAPHIIITLNNSS